MKKINTSEFIHKPCKTIFRPGDEEQLLLLELSKEAIEHIIKTLQMSLTPKEKGGYGHTDGFIYGLMGTFHEKP